MKANYRIDSVLCLVDAKNIVRQLERTATEEGAVNEAVQQLAFADSVIINKTDLVSAEELGAVKDKITSVNAFAKVVQAEKVRLGWLARCRRRCRKMSGRFSLSVGDLSLSLLASLPPSLALFVCACGACAFLLLASAALTS